MAKGNQDVVGFTRIFVLFCTLVLLPAMLMSGFGVIAILNERQADKQRRREAAERVLQDAEATLVALLDRSDRGLKASLNAIPVDGVAPAVAQARAAGGPVGPYAILDDDGGLVTGEPPFVGDDEQAADLRARIQRLAKGVATGGAAHMVVDDDALSSVLSLQRLAGGRLFIYALDDDALQRDLLATADPNLDVHPVLRVATENADTPIAGALERLMAELRGPSEPVAAGEATEPEELVSRRLAAPFDRYTLAVVSVPGKQARTAVVVYVVLLLVFYATLITGVVITARLIWQETRISRLKTDFVSHVSHELRTPLTSIRLFIETLKFGRAQSPEEEQECLDLLAKETERLSEMIERVLGYARLKAGRRLFNLRTVDPGRIVDEALDAFRAQTLGGDDKALVLEKDVEPGLPPLRADRDAMVEALLNLVGNAYKYTGPEKHIVVFARRSKLRKRVVIGVKDNGPGLPKHEHARIFERFYQAGSGLLSKKTPGSGLGLAITRAIVEGQGGKIGVESEPGKGATFVLELRMDPAAAKAAAKAAKVAAA